MTSKTQIPFTLWTLAEMLGGEDGTYGASIDGVAEMLDSFQSSYRGDAWTQP